MDSVPKETHVVSVMTEQPLATVAVVREKKDDRLLPAPNSKVKTDAGREKSSKTSEATLRKDVQTKGAKFRAGTKIVKNPVV